MRAQGVQRALLGSLRRLLFPRGWREVSNWIKLSSHDRIPFSALHRAQSSLWWRVSPPVF